MSIWIPILTVIAMAIAVLILAGMLKQALDWLLNDED